MELKPLNSFTGTERKLLGLFGVDAGNHDTKSRHTTFASGFQKSSVVNKLASEYIEMTDKNGENYFYTVTNTPFNLSTKKTESEDMFIITMIAVAKEAVSRGISIDGDEIDLAIGMPPGMYTQANVDVYYEYYMSRGKDVRFTYNGIPFRFRIGNVVVSAQCWGAAAQYPHLHKELNDVYLVDIGGGTTDVLHMSSGQIDGEPQSYNDGVNKMFAVIANTLNSETGIRFTPKNVKAALMGKSDMPDKYTKRIKELAYDWTKNIFTRMMTEGAEFRLTKVITLGGGPLILDDEIERAAKELDFLERLTIRDNKANATGYELVAALALYRIKSKVVNEFWRKFDAERCVNDSVNDNEED